MRSIVYVLLIATAAVVAHPGPGWGAVLTGFGVG
jgi:hypothetical protein